MGCKTKLNYLLVLLVSIFLLWQPALTMSDPAGARTKEIDVYSYNLGVIGAFSEVVSLGIKKLALSAPLPAGEMAQMMPEAKKIVKRNGVSLYLEKSFLVTDLFPEETTRGRQVLLIYKENTLKKYLSLKDKKKKLVKSGLYRGEARQRIAMEMGRLLSYPQTTIDKMLKE